MNDNHNYHQVVDVDIENNNESPSDHRKELSSNASSFSDMREPLLSKSRMNNSSQVAIVGAKSYPIESLDYEYGQLFSYLLLFLLRLICFHLFSYSFFIYLQFIYLCIFNKFRDRVHDSMLSPWFSNLMNYYFEVHNNNNNNILLRYRL